MFELCSACCNLSGKTFQYPGSTRKSVETDVVIGTSNCSFGGDSLLAPTHLSASFSLLILCTEGKAMTPFIFSQILMARSMSSTIRIVLYQ